MSFETDTVHADELAPIGSSLGPAKDRYLVNNF